MSLLRTAVSRASLLAPRTVEKTSVRFYEQVQGGPAGRKVSKTEMLLTQAFIATGILAYPFWVIFHVEEYKRRGNPQQE